MASYPTLKSFLASLGTERQCQWLLCKVRWPDGDSCPRCGSREVNLVDSAGLTGKGRSGILRRCRDCKHHFSATAGTIFHDTRLDIRDWFLAIYLMGSIKKGIRAAQLETYLGVSHETALNMVDRIRAAVKQDKHFLKRYVRLPKRNPAIIEAPAACTRPLPTLHAVVHKFTTEAQTLEHLARVHWPTGPKCPKCKNADVRKIHSKSSGRPLYRCPPCKKQFTVTSGLFFKGLRRASEWLIAVYLVETNPRGISPKQMERLLGLSYRRAAYLIRGFRDKEKTRKALFKLYIGYNGLIDKRTPEAEAVNVDVAPMDSPRPAIDAPQGAAEPAERKDVEAITVDALQPATNLAEGVSETAVPPPPRILLPADLKRGSIGRKSPFEAS
jgi:transposase-like protein